MKKFVCIKKISNNRVTFQPGDIIIVTNDKKEYYMINDKDYMKGMLVVKLIFEQHFKELKK